MSASLMAKPFRKAGGLSPVPATEVKRFGHAHSYGDARTPVVAELHSGEIVLVPLAAQTDANRREIRRRLKDEVHPSYRALSRDVPVLFSWEHPEIGDESHHLAMNGGDL
jgi:hypothetical protein